MKMYYNNTGGPMSRNLTMRNYTTKPKEEKDTENLNKIIERYEEQHKSFIKLNSNANESEQFAVNEVDKKNVNINFENFGFKAVYETNFCFADNENVVDYIYNIMKSYKINDEEKLKKKFLVFKKKLICVTMPIIENKDKFFIDKDEILKDTVILGLCGEHIYDPERPLILTEANLKRKVILYEPRGFYDYI